MEASEALFILVIIAIGLLPAIGLLVRFITSATRDEGRLGKQARLGRWICGIAGISIVAAVGIGTICHLQNVYRAAVSADSNGLISVPKKTRLTPPALRDNELEAPFEGRFLLQSMLIYDNGRIVRAQTNDLSWPQAKGKQINTRFNINGMNIRDWIKLESVKWRRDGSLTVKGNYWAGLGLDSASSENLLPLQYGFMLSQSPLKKLFILSRTYHNERAEIFNVIIPIQQDDPLVLQSAYSFLNDRNEPAATVVNRGFVSREDEYARWTATARLSLLIGRTGSAFFILLIGALLTAQFFRKKAMATTVSLFLMMLYVVALDRIALDRHLRVLSDAGQPERIREFACWNADMTFFNNAKKEEVYDRLMRDASTHKALRETILSAAQMHQEPKLYDYSELPSEPVLSILLSNATKRNNATLAELQRSNPRCLWLKHHWLIVSLPASCGKDNGGKRGYGRQWDRNFAGRPAAWPNGVIYRRLWQDTDGFFWIEFNLDDQISEALGFEKGKLWTARFTLDEILSGFGFGQHRWLFPEDVYKDSYGRERILLAHAGLTK